MRFAYLILAHKGGDQLLQLVRKLLSGNDDFAVIHLDLKWIDAPVEHLRAEYGERVRLAGRARVRWGHWSQCVAILRLMEALSGLEYDYAHFISGQDWPIMPRDRLVRELDPEVSYINFSEEGYDHRMDFFNFEEWFIDPRGTELDFFLKYHVGRISRALKGLYFRFGWKRPNPFGPSWKKGSQWWSLSRKAVVYATPRLAKLVRSGRLRFTRCSDEHAVQTIIYYSEFGRRSADNRRYYNWPDDTPSPYTLRRENIPAIEASGRWFCRKVDADVDTFFYDLPAGRASMAPGAPGPQPSISA